MKINEDDFQAAKDYRTKINRVDIYELEIYKDGVLLEVTKPRVEEWRFTGLSNWDFVEMVLEED